MRQVSFGHFWHFCKLEKICTTIQQGKLRKLASSCARKRAVEMALSFGGLEHFCWSVWSQVSIDPTQNLISVWNNGKGVPVQIHQEHSIHVPELIFGHLLTSSNYDDNEKKTTGGRNGFGAKLTNIFSTGACAWQFFFLGCLKPSSILFRMIILFWS